MFYPIAREILITTKCNNATEGIGYYRYSLYNILLGFMMGAGIHGATVINGVDGFARRENPHHALNVSLLMTH
jgi:PII-like signaling protein